MDKIYKLYQEWYAQNEYKYIKNIEDDALWIQFEHNDGGAVTHMHYAYDEQPELLIRWETLAHGIWLLGYIIDNGNDEIYRLSFKHLDRTIVSHYSISSLYRLAVQQLDDNSLRQFKQRSDVLESVIECITNAGWEFEEK